MQTADIIDTMLEATIVGSFTKAGYAARSKLRDWDAPSVDMSGQRVVITGATSGIGRATAEGVFALGADLIVTSRDQDRAESAASEIAASTDGTGSVTGLALDTSEFDSVNAACEAIVADGPIDVLIHNAGALTDEYRTNSRGMESTLASHLVGPYLLTTELRSSIRDGGRVLWMSSGGMYTQRLDVDALEMTEDGYRGAIAYARAKRAQVELVAHLGPQWAPGVVMHAMHPGWVDTPGVEQGLPGFRKIMGPALRDAAEGADTMIWLAATGGDAEPGTFWLDRRPRSTSYLPFTSVGVKERRALVDWLDLVTLPGRVG